MEEPEDALVMMCADLRGDRGPETSSYAEGRSSEVSKAKVVVEADVYRSTRVRTRLTQVRLGQDLG